MEILKIENVNFTYPLQEQPALRQIDLHIDEGEFVLLCGESGCGKTTLLKLLKRELAPHGEKTGVIYYRGKPAEELSDREAAAQIGYVMQNPDSQLVTDKVWHEMAFGLENLGMSTPQIRRRVGEMASFFGIASIFREEVATLSGGQKQLLNMASIMAMSPSVLLLDEPTSQLDPIAASDFIGMLQKINKELGMTILLVEHRLEEVFPIVDRVLVMEEGQIAITGTPREVGLRLKEEPGHKILYGLPSAVRIFHGLQIKDECPLTVREGRNFLNRHFPSAVLAETREATDWKKDRQTVMDVEHVWFRYEKEAADILEDISLSLYEGELLCVLGGNGFGKSTLLKIIAAQEKAYKGQVRIRGKKLKEYKGNSLYKDNLAMLPQNPQSLFLKSTVQEDYGEICKVMGYKKNEYEDQIRTIAEKMGITHLLGQHPYDLSGGEQQKAALGKILLLQPRIILMDEPTKGIDAFAKHRLGELLRMLKSEGVSILMVTHDVEFAAENADRCAMLFDKNITSLDTPERFFSGNQFYTTAANRMARHLYPEAITCDQVVDCCKGGKMS